MFRITWRLLACAAPIVASVALMGSGASAQTKSDTVPLPPVIVEYRGPGLLRLCDGSHRHEAIRRRGVDTLWALVWCADIAAYAVGRTLGRHKLAPQVSPGKSREGAVGGVVAAVLWLAATAVWWPDSFGALLLNRLGWPGLLLSGVVLAAWSIVGDLFESLLKRRAGVKDSSRLLPGHGGVYDRIDAVLPVAPAAVLLLLL